MGGAIYRYLAEDHRRLDDALRRADRYESIDQSAYREFRAGLLRHIAMEEKILLPAAQRAHGGKLAIASKLRLDHSALAALLVPTPTKAILNAIRTVLVGHNPIEEDSGGVYEQCEQLAGSEADEILDRLKAAPPVLLAPHADSGIAMESARKALQRAGYDLKI